MRGDEYGQVRDTYGNTIKVYGSSAVATGSGETFSGDCAWIQVENDEGQTFSRHHLHGTNGLAAHVSPEQARELAEVLMRVAKGRPLENGGE